MKNANATNHPNYGKKLPMPFFLLALFVLFMLALFDLAMAVYLFAWSKSVWTKSLLVIIACVCLRWLCIMDWEQPSIYFHVANIVCALPLIRLIVAMVSKTSAFQSEIKLVCMVSIFACLNWLWWLGGVRSFS